MNIQIRRLNSALLLPIIILLPALLWSNKFVALPSPILALWPYFPYAILFIGLLLSWIFNHSREFNILVLLHLTYWVFDNVLWPHALGKDSGAGQLLYSLIIILLPINFLLHDLLKERGILNVHGIKRLLTILLQAGIIFWLVKVQPFDLLPWLHYQFYSSDLTGFTALPQLGVIVSAACTFTLFIYVITHPNTLQGALLGTLISSLVAVHYLQQPTTARLFFILAGIMVVTAIILNSHYLAYCDELTRLPSRRALKQQLMALGNTYSIAMVDVDHFKKLNDNYGHDVGDQVLQMLAAQLIRVKGTSKAFRYGGEEFTLVFPGKSSTDAKPHLETFRTTLASTPFVMRKKSRPKNKPKNLKPKKQSKAITVTVSIGVADQNSAQTSPQEVIKAADDALYQAKKKGRNRVVVG